MERWNTEEGEEETKRREETRGDEQGRAETRGDEKGREETRRDENRRHPSKRSLVLVFTVCKLARQLAGVNRRNYIEEKLPRDNSD